MNILIFLGVNYMNLWKLFLISLSFYHVVECMDVNYDAQYIDHRYCRMNKIYLPIDDHLVGGLIKKHHDDNDNMNQQQIYVVTTIVMIEAKDIFVQDVPKN